MNKSKEEIKAELRESAMEYMGWDGSDMGELYTPTRSDMIEHLVEFALAELTSLRYQAARSLGLEERVLPRPAAPTTAPAPTPERPLSVAEQAARIAVANNPTWVEAYRATGGSGHVLDVLVYAAMEVADGRVRPSDMHPAVRREIERIGKTSRA